MTLSIIVPVYNVEHFLRRCLDSLLRQGLEVGEYEIICVNDGSSDGSAAILDAYVLQYPDVFRVFSQRNMGLAEARITGIKEVRGEYVAFVDADDYVVDGGYRYLIDHFLEKRPDVLQFAYTYIYTDGQRVLTPDCGPEGEVTFEGDGVDLYNYNFSWSVWSKLYKTTALGPRFTDSFRPCISEDVFFNFSIFWEHPHTLQVSSNIYRYERNNINSVQETKRKDLVLRQMRVLLEEVDLMQTYLQGDHLALVPAAHHFTYLFLDTFYKKILCVVLSRREWNTIVKQLKQRPVHQLSYQTNWLGRVVALLKNATATSYEAYRLIYLIYQNIFKRYIFPKMYAQ